MFHRCHMSHDLFHIGVIISLSHDSIAMLPFYVNMGIVLFRNFKSLKIPSQRHVSILCCIYDLSWSVTDGLDSISKIASNLMCHTLFVTYITGSTWCVTFVNTVV